MTRPNFRSLVFDLHRWLGLHLALFFIFMFVTGTLLVVSDEIEALFHPKIWTSAPEHPASFGEIHASVTQKFPQAQLFVIERQPQPWLADRSYMTTGWGEKIIVWTDPIDATVVEVTKAANFRAFLHELHDSLLVPRRVAFVLVASTSLLLLAMIVTGLITYRRFWKGFFRWPSQTMTPRNRQGGLHRLLAVWVFIFLLITSVSGTFFIMTGLGMNGHVPQPKPADPGISIASAGFTGDLIDRAERIAIGTTSGLHPTSMALPRKPTDGIRFEGYSSKNGILTGATAVSVGPSDLQVLGVAGPDQFRGNARLKPLMNALHFGQWADPVSRILWVVFGGLATYLIIAGLKVSVFRQPTTANARRPGIYRGVMQQLGLFKWAYGILILLVIGLGVLQYGPPAAKWVTLKPETADASGIRLQLFGPLRQNTDMQLQIGVEGDQIQSIQALTPNHNRPIPVFDAANTASVAKFSSHAQQDSNRITLSVRNTAGGETTLVYDLGAAIW